MKIFLETLKDKVYNDIIKEYSQYAYKCIITGSTPASIDKFKKEAIYTIIHFLEGEKKCMAGRIEQRRN